MATKKLNEGHYHEMLDRLHIQMSILEEHLIKHPVAKQNTRIKESITQAINKLSKAYLTTGAELYKIVTNDTK